MTVKKIITFLLISAIVLSLAYLPVLSEEVPEGFASLEDYYNYLVFGETTTQEEPELHDMKLVAENSKFSMYYYANGADIYLEDKATGKVWGSAVRKEYADIANMSANAVSNLMTVCYTDKSNSLLEVDLTAASTNDFSVTESYGANSVTIDIKMKNTGISFKTVFSLEEDGMKVNIPYDSISENDEFKLVSIKLLPLFGAAKPGEDGYIFYPDGSGAIMNIGNYKKDEPEFYNYSIYCSDKADFDVFDSNTAQDIKSLMLPVFGIKHTSGAVFAEIDSGDTNASLHIGVDNFYQSYFELSYRTYNTVLYEFASKASGEINVVGTKTAKGDRTVYYHIFSGEKNTYSDMAVCYRQKLIDSGVLKDKLDLKTVPLSVELFMGISKSGLIGNSIQKLTTYNGAKDIVNSLYENGVENLDVLLKGWCDGGYDTLPTNPNVSKKLGSRAEFNSLIETVKNKNGNVFLLADLINGNSETGKFNAEKVALRNGLDTVITDSDTNARYWLNPLRYMKSAIANFESLQKDGVAICFDSVGNWLLSDVGETGESSRGEIADAISKSISDADKISGSVAVVGGNFYTLKNADRMFDLTDTDSQYYQTDFSVPFYQMVVHGYKTYSSLAANLSFDYNYQRLKFVETGSVPHFILTENSPNLLQGTSYDDIFSSEYSLWKDTVTNIWKEMNERLGGVWNLTMDSHEYINSTLVKVGYSDGSAVYINYADHSQTVSNIEIKPLDYVLVKGE